MRDPNITYMNTQRFVLIRCKNAQGIPPYSTHCAVVSMYMKDILKEYL